MEQFPYLHGTFVELRPRAGIPYLLQPEFDEIIVDPVLWICLCYHLSRIFPTPKLFLRKKKRGFNNKTMSSFGFILLATQDVGFFLFLLKRVVLKFRVGDQRAVMGIPFMFPIHLTSCLYSLMLINAS